MNVIETSSITKKFKDFTALNNISLSVAENEIFGLIGPDGAGKTTFMRLLTTVSNPTSGNISVLGYDSVKQSQQIKDFIGYMSQRFGLYPDLTVLENLKFYADIYNIPKTIWLEKQKDLLDFSGLNPFIKRKAGKLSGGMKQKLGLACSLIHTPRILFLDEPTNGVDPVSRREFWKILYKLVKEGLTVVVSTAYLDEAERCNRIGLLHNGVLIGYGTPLEIKKIIPDKIIKIICKNPQKTKNILLSHFKVESITLFGDSLHIVTKENLSNKINQFLKNSKIEDFSFQTIQPELEDVLISLIEKKDA